MKLLLRRLIWGLVVVGIVGLIVYGFLPQPVPVDLAAATIGPLRVTVDQEGKTRVKDRYVVAAPLGGQLERIQWKPGKPIYKGSTVLATIWPRETEFLDPSARAQAQAKVKALESALERAEATLRQAHVRQEYAQRDRERYERLREQRVISQQELDTARQAERVAAEEVRQSQEAIEMARYELQQARAVLQRTYAIREGEAPPRFDVLAPITGQVFKVEQESATVVTPGAKLLEIGDPNDLEVVVDVLSAAAVKIPEKARVLLEHWGGEEPLEAWVHVVEPSGFTKVSALGVEEQRVNVIARFRDPEAARRLGDGYRVEARIVVWEKADALKVPAGAVQRLGQEWSVFVLADGKARRQPVVPGRSNGLETEIVSGLEVGQAVIVHPGDRVQDGTAVVPRQ